MLRCLPTLGLLLLGLRPRAGGRRSRDRDEGRSPASTSIAPSTRSPTSAGRCSPPITAPDVDRIRAVVSDEDRPRRGGSNGAITSPRSNSKSRRSRRSPARSNRRRAISPVAPSQPLISRRPPPPLRSTARPGRRSSFCRRRCWRMPGRWSIPAASRSPPIAPKRGETDRRLSETSTTSPGATSTAAPGRADRDVKGVRVADGDNFAAKSPRLRRQRRRQHPASTAIRR